MFESEEKREDKGLFLRAILLALAAFLLWNVVANMIWPRESQPSTNGNGHAQIDSNDNGVGPSPTPPNGESTGGTATGANGIYRLNGASEEETYVLGGVDPEDQDRYRMAVWGTNRGAGIDTVRLADYFEEVKSENHYTLLSSNALDTENAFRSFVVETVFVDKHAIPVGDALWHLRRETQGDADTAILTLDVVGDDDEPMVQLIRRYRVPVQRPENERFDFFADLEVRNLSQGPHAVHVNLRGPLGMQRADTRFDDRGLLNGTITGAGVFETEFEQAQSFEGKSDSLFTAEAGGALQWAALGNKFFVALVAPVPYRQAMEPADYLRSAIAVDLDGMKSEMGAPSNVTLRFATREVTLNPAEGAEFNFETFLGPKSKAAFTKDANADYIERHYLDVIDASYSVGPCAILTPNWLIHVMLKLLGWFYFMVRNYGIAIIILVLVVRTILHPITKSTQVNMMRMQEKQAAIVPKTEEIKKKYANDKVKLQQEQMKIYREAGINPAGSVLTCIPMFLQMPVWIALYTSLNYNIDMRHQPFFLWINDLSAPDCMFRFTDGPGFYIPLIGAMTGPINCFNLLPILLAISMFVQQKLMPKPQHADPNSPAAQQAAQMQKMMPIMSVIFAVFMYNMPSGLTLYIMASNFFGTIEQMRIRKHIKERKERGDFHKPPKQPKGPRTPGFWSKLQKMAEEAQQQQTSAKKKSR